jgi:hypothetical protein
MAWTRTKTAVAAAVVILLMMIMAREAVKKRAGTIQIEEGQAHEGTTQMRLTGTAGATVIGMYVQNGEMFTVSNSLPWSFTGTNISRVEFQKVKPDDAIAIDLVYDGDGTHARMTEHLDAGSGRMEARVENGFIVTLHQR